MSTFSHLGSMPQEILDMRIFNNQNRKIKKKKSLLSTYDMYQTFEKK